MSLQSQHYSTRYFQKFYYRKNGIKALVLAYIDRKGPVFSFLKHQYMKESILVDFGCGNGLFLSHAEKYFKTFGIDFSKDAIRMAKTVAQKTKYFLGGIESVSEVQKRASIITCFDVLEHIEIRDHKKIIQKLSHNLEADGALVVSVPITDSLMRKIRGKRWWALEDPSHVSLKPRSYWINMFSNQGLNVRRVFSSGFINHPDKRYRLNGGLRLLQIFFQTLGLLGIQLPKMFSDVDFYVLQKRVD
jgi:cyclopropane fatty-acyl-phospholipid synthase-like methyltransferase